MKNNLPKDHEIFFSKTLFLQDYKGLWSVMRNDSISLFVTNYVQRYQ